MLSMVNVLAVGFNPVRFPLERQSILQLRGEDLHVISAPVSLAISIWLGVLRGGMDAHPAMPSST